MSHPFIKKFKHYAQQTRWRSTDDARFLVAVSGGVDSTVLGWLFFWENIPFAVAHVNFTLRGQDSDDDERFVENLSKNWGVPFFNIRFDTAHAAQLTGESVQTCARRLRRRWLEELRTTHGFDAIALAHHLDDQIETVLFNFSRGTGLTGLRGMLPVREHWVRPLLFATRAEIVSFAHAQHILWREDASNASDEYARNFIRHHIVPKLLELNPQLHDVAAQNLVKLRQTADNHAFFLENWLRDHLQHNATADVVSLSKKDLQTLPAPEELLLFWLHPFGFDAGQCQQIADNLDRQPGYIWHSASHQLNLDRTDLLLATRPPAQQPVFLHADDLMVSLPGGGRIVLLRQPTNVGFVPPRHEPLSVWLDADSLHFPLCLRPWHPGDVFQPLGMQGKHKKVKDFLTDLKLSRLEKQRQTVLTDAQGNVIWVVGRRADHRFQVHSGSASSIKIAVIS